ncbi:esterase [Bordetella genomosp. 9]|nr:esterase [Bordetella genomosp. 9]
MTFGETFGIQWKDAVRGVAWKAAARGIVARVATAALAMVAMAGAMAAPPASTSTGKPLTLQAQGSFFVGGREVRSDTLSTAPGRGAEGTITVDQMYVSYQIPPRARRYSITLIHGCCLTGKTWETTPDGRMGWQEYFVRKGYATYTIDQVARGRSAFDPSAINSVKMGKTAPDTLPALFAAGHEEAWTVFRFGPEYPKPYPNLAFPLEAQAELWKQLVPDWFAALPSPNPTVPNLSTLARQLRGTILMSHSQGGVYPFQTAAISAEGIAGIVAIEPTVCPAATGDLKPYTRLPILVVYGDNVEIAPRWAPRLQKCREFIDAVAKAGGNARLVELPQVGFRGNSHMLMQDRNSLKVADWLLDWIDRNIEKQPRPRTAGSAG